VRKISLDLTIQSLKNWYNKHKYKENRRSHNSSQCIGFAFKPTFVVPNREKCNKAKYRRHQQTTNENSKQKIVQKPFRPAAKCENCKIAAPENYGEGERQNSRPADFHLFPLCIVISFAHIIPFQ
jgi:hypothetical protein